MSARLMMAGLLLAISLAPAASAAVESEVVFELRATIAEDRSLELCATGTMRYRRLVRGFAAALYRESCHAPPRDQAQRLELAYFWSIDGDRFGRAAEAQLKQNLDPGTFLGLVPRLSILHRAYQSARPGDRYALTYVPGRGTELALNGETLATVPGADFAEAYFDIWLGETPLDRALRDALLRGSQRAGATGDVR